MKKYFRLRLAAVLVALVPLLVWGSTRTKTVTLSYNAGDFTLALTGGKTLITSNVHDVSCVCDTVAPAIPRFVINVLVAPNERLVSFSSSLSNSTTWQNVDIAPCEIPVTTDTDYTGQYPDVTFTGTYSAYVQCDSIMSIDGYRFVRFVVSPFAYDGSTQVLSLNQSVSISMTLQTFVPVGNPLPADSLISGAVMRGPLSDMCINGGEMQSLYGDYSLPDTDDGDEPYRYLLITKQMYRPYIKRLAEWKTRKGVRAKFLTLEEINTTFGDSNDSIQTKIKAAIKYYYDRGLQYVLLGGDENVVPVKREYLERKIFENHVPVDTLVHHVASDLYYASINESNKCNNAASHFIHQNDSVAFGSDLVITRTPFSSGSHALFICERIINYESAPDTINWQENMLMTGVSIADTITGTMSDVHERSYKMDSLYIRPYWPGVAITRFFDTGTDYFGGANYNVTWQNFQAELGKGYKLIHIDTHGSDHALAMETGDIFNKGMAYQLHNSGYSVLALTSCTTNAFDLGPACIAESFMSNQHGGVLGYFACSREGWSGPSFDLNCLFFRQLLKDPTHCYGRAAIAAKNEFAESKEYDYYKHWLLIGVNPLGDPEMPVFVSKPKKLTAPRYTFTNGTLYVTNLVDSCNICVMSEADFGETYYAVHRNVQGSSVFHNVPTNSSICITKPGYIPLVTNLQQLSVVQNTTIADDMLIVGDAVVVGEAVTNEIPHGPVIVESGTTTIVAPNGVKLCPGTYVRKGAGLKIQTK